jgi:anti-anti-sigma regulatory factor
LNRYSLYNYQITKKRSQAQDVLGDGASIMNQTEKFSYFFSEKGPILVINLIGPIAKHNSRDIEQCLNKCKKIQADWVIVNFRDVPTFVDKSFLVPTLARFQKTIRDAKANLLLSGLHPEFKMLLKESGCLREEELRNNLTEALQSLIAQKAAA